MVDFWVRNHDLLQINFKHQKNKKLICRNFINMSRTYWEADQAQFLTRTWLLSFDLFFPKNKSVITSRIFEHFLYFYNDNKEDYFLKNLYFCIYFKNHHCKYPFLFAQFWFAKSWLLKWFAQGAVNKWHGQNFGQLLPPPPIYTDLLNSCY